MCSPAEEGHYERSPHQAATFHRHSLPHIYVLLTDLGSLHHLLHHSLSGRSLPGVISPFIFHFVVYCSQTVDRHVSISCWKQTLRRLWACFNEVVDPSLTRSLNHHMWGGHTSAQSNSVEMFKC